MAGLARLDLAPHAQAWQDFLAMHGWFLVLQLLDLATTLAVFALGGGEGNPAMARAVAVRGDVALLGAKLVVAILSLTWLLGWVVVLRQRPDVRRWSAPALLTGMVLAVAAYTAVVFYNLTNVEVLLHRA